LYDPVWLEELKSELVRRRLPPDYVARLVEELSDHIDDFLEDQMSTDALESNLVVERFGSPHEVASRAANEYRGRRFTGRHPLFAFVVLPVVALPLAWSASVFGLIGAGAAWKSLNPGLSSDALSPWGVAGMKLLCTALLVLPAALLAALFAWLAARSAVARKWPIIGCTILGLLVGPAQFSMYVSPLPNKSTIMLGMGVSTSPSAIFRELSKFGVPMLVGMWVFSRRAFRERSQALAS
jgi:hypothetical protein